MKSFTLLMLATAVIISMLAGCGTTQQACPKIGDKAPDFTLTTLDSKNISLSGFAGKPVVINTWDLDCKACKEEMPFFQELYAEYFQDKVVFISIDTGNDNTASIKDYLKKNNYTFSVSQDYGGKLFKPKYCFLSANPYTVFIDANGIINHIQPGSFATKQELENRIVNLISH
jgi:peroxiredoxin